MSRICKTLPYLSIPKWLTAEKSLTSPSSDITKEIRLASSSLAKEFISCFETRKYFCNLTQRHWSGNQQMKRICSGLASLRISGVTKVASWKEAKQGVIRERMKRYGPWMATRELARGIGLWPHVIASVEVLSDMKED